MNIEQFILDFSEIVDVESSQITENTEFKTMEEWTSLSALALMAMIEDEYDVAIKREELMSATTLGELFHAVEEHKL